MELRGTDDVEICGVLGGGNREAFWAFIVGFGDLLLSTLSEFRRLPAAIMRPGVLFTGDAPRSGLALQVVASSADHLRRKERKRDMPGR